MARFRGIWVAALVAGACSMSTQTGAVSWIEEEVEFSSQGARLSGTVIVPRTGKVLAGVVFVHGSGMQVRARDLARRFATDGIAMLTYDKRGVGRSGGEYPAQRTISEKNFNLLAGDASAALDRLAAHPRVDGVPLGFVGFSQAGYLVPLAAVRNRKVRFIALWSGPVCKASEEDIYSVYTSDRDLADPPTFEQVRRWRADPYEWDVANYGKDTDVSESLGKLSIPGFWIFGGRDGSIPVDLSLARLRDLRNSGQPAYEYALFSSLGHDTVDASYPTMVQWIRRATNLATSVAAAPADALQRYAGTYVSDQPRIEVRVTVRDGRLFAAAKREPLPLERVGPASFMAHDPGQGFVFLDFDPARDAATLSQAGFMVPLARVGAGNAPAQ
jgi:uncharacterized protein